MLKYVFLDYVSSDLPYILKEYSRHCIIRRGPDSLREISIRHGDVTVDLVGSVLNMRPPLTPQPVSNDKGDTLLWNGEVFGGLTVCIAISCVSTLLE